MTEPSEEDAATTMHVASRIVYRNALARIKEKVFGHDHLVPKLAMAATQHIISPASAIRLTLIGPSGSGKTTMARALAAATNRPFVEFSMTDMVQTGWQGHQLSDLISDSLMQQASALHRAGKGEINELMGEAVLFIDEADKAAFAGMDPTSRSHYIGKQQTILGLLGSNGRVIAGSHSLSTNCMMVISGGVFAGMRKTTNPSPADIEALGFLHELVERMGIIHVIDPISGEALKDVLRSGLAANIATARAFGYHLEITDQALSYTANAVRNGVAGPRSGVSWLRSAADNCLGRVLAADAPEGTRITVSPDDLCLPDSKEAGQHGRPPVEGDDPTVFP